MKKSFKLLVAFFVCLISLSTSAQNFQQMIKLLASDRTASDNFGNSVAISGDYAIVGAYQQDSDAYGGNYLSAAGAAYIFYRNNGIWQFQQKIVASDRTASDNFGNSVAISGDYAIVGVPNQDSDANGANYLSNAGAAYIYYRTGTTWTQQQKIVASDRGALNLFGASVAIGGDYIIVGATGNKYDASGLNSKLNAGAAYLFLRSGTTWSQQQKIVAADRAASDNFGNSVAMSGDYAIVAASGQDSDAYGANYLSAAGAAYIFNRSGITWSQEQKIVASDRAASDVFGNSVAMSGNYAIVGAYHSGLDASGANPSTFAGSAYIYYNNGTTWNQQQKIVASDRTTYDVFGGAVTISDNYAIVGAIANATDINGQNFLGAAGSAYIYNRNGTTWSQQQKIVASDRASNTAFGNAVAIDGNYGLVGSRSNQTDTNAANAMTAAGAAYLFERPLTPIISSVTPSSGSVGTLVTITGTNLSTPTTFQIGGVDAIVISNTDSTILGMVMPGATTGTISVTTVIGTGTSATNFSVNTTPYPATQQGSKLVGTGNTGAADQGYSAAISADGNTAVVGAIKDNSNQGAVWVYARSGGSWSQQGGKLVGTGGSGTPQQGYSLAISADGNTVIVGANADNSANGAAWIFTRTGTTWSQQGNKLVGTGNSGIAFQGTSVGISADGNTAIVGGNYDNSGVGAAWIFTRTGTTWSQEGNKLVGTGATGNGFQGGAVSISADGNTAIVGGFADDSYQGATWVFTRTGSTWTQQGNKLVGTGASGGAQQGTSVSLSADGNTAIIGGYADNSFEGAAWVFSRSGSTWSQQGNKLVGTGFTGNAAQGKSVSLSADGNTAIVGGISDNSSNGAAWIFTRTDTTWSQQGSKLVGTGGSSDAQQGTSVAISADGKTSIVGGSYDNSEQGAAWVFKALNTWTGASSSDWNTAGNWTDNAVPTSTDAVIIPSGTTNPPNLNNASYAVQSITQASGQTTSLGSGNLTTTGDITNNGTFTGTGKIILNGTSAQSISGTGTVSNLELDNSNGATVASGSNQMNVTGLLSLTSGTLTTNDNLVLKSTSDTATAKVGPVLGAISGNVTHERYLSAPGNGSGGRSWRLITAPLKGSTNNSIFYNWQNNGTNNGTGIELWSPSGTGVAGNGLTTGGTSPSIYKYNAATNAYTAVTNTTTEPLFDASGNKAFLAFVSGSYGSGNITGGAAATNANAGGTLITGTQDFAFTPTSASNNLQLIGNPYNCPIDFDKVYSHSTNIYQKFWVIDPSLNNIGGYVVVSWNGSSYDVVPSSAQNQYIQTGQAFFVAAPTVAAANVEIQESDKETTAAQTAMFRTNGGNLETFRINLNKTINGTMSMIDGALFNCHQNLSNTIGNEDATKFGNFNEAISILEGTTKLAIDGRQLFDDGDSIHIAMGNMQQTNYQLELQPGSINAPGLTATLYDNFLSTSTPVSLTSNTVYPFTVTSNSASSSNNRFKILFSGSNPLAIKFLNVNAQKEASHVNITWTVADQTGTNYYNVERSTDGKSFSNLGTVNVANQTDYTFTDNTPVDGKNYYRIKAVARSTSGVYSNVVTVNMSSKDASISTYPNPVSGNTIQLNISNLDKGVYMVNLFSTTGQKVLSKEISYAGGSSMINLNIAGLAAGIYQLQLLDNNGQNVATEKLIKQ